MDCNLQRRFELRQQLSNLFQFIASCESAIAFVLANALFTQLKATVMSSETRATAAPVGNHIKALAIGGLAL